MRTQVGMIGNLRAGGADAGAAAAPSRHRLRHRREPQPRLHRKPHPRRTDRALGRRSSSRARRRRAHETRTAEHYGINIGINGALHHLDFKALVDKHVTIYGQQEVVKDMVAQRLADGDPLLFEVDDVSVHDLNRSSRPSASRMTARRRRSSAISSPAATAFTAFAGRASPTVRAKYSTAIIRSAGSAFYRTRRRPITN